MSDRDLDALWAAVYSLGGAARPGDLYDAGYNQAIDDALRQIEKAGGRDTILRGVEAKEKYNG